jgi:hypothetical protein
VAAILLEYSDPRGFVGAQRMIVPLDGPAEPEGCPATGALRPPHRRRPIVATGRACRLRTPPVWG